MCCSVLQSAVVCCMVLQCVALISSVVQCRALCCSVVHCVALCCNVLQRVAVSCIVLQCVGVSCSVYTAKYQTCFALPKKTHSTHFYGAALQIVAAIQRDTRLQKSPTKTGLFCKSTLRTDLSDYLHGAASQIVIASWRGAPSS